MSETQHPVHTILGMGEVGSALHAVLADTYPVAGIDLTIRSDIDLIRNTRVLHIALPWTEDMNFTVSTWTAQMPNLDAAVCHSTVPVGTARQHGWCFSPVTGKHPDLAESLRTFTKPVAGPTIATAAQIAASLRAAGIPAITAGTDTRSLEASKLIDLALYGIDIRTQKEVWRYCQNNDLDYTLVYEAAGRHYNTGYRTLGMEHLTRRELTHRPGPIGGHCVSENLSLLDDPGIEDLARPATKEHWDAWLD